MIVARLAAAALALLLVPAGAAGTAGPGMRCLVGTDARADSTAYPPARPADPAAELIALQMGVAGESLVVDLQVSRIQVPAGDPSSDAHSQYPGPPTDPVSGGAQAAGTAGAAGEYGEDQTSGNMWRVLWEAAEGGPDSSYTIWAQRWTGTDSFWLSVPGDPDVPLTGSIFESTGIVRIMVPRGLVDAPIGARLFRIAADAWTVTGGVADMRDSMPEEWPSKVSYTVGHDCADQALTACPVAVDAAGEAGPGEPANEPALDLLAAGAESSRDTLTLSLRVADAAAPPPVGFDLAGWTVSWGFDGVRWAAQAERYADGSLVFRAGATAAAPDEFPGPYFGGVAVRGSMDVANGVVAIRIPRESAGDPADGETLTDLGAQSWAMATGNTASPYQIADATEMRPYRMGVACGV